MWQIFLVKRKFYKFLFSEVIFPLTDGRKPEYKYRMNINSSTACKRSALVSLYIINISEIWCWLSKIVGVTSKYLSRSKSFALRTNKLFSQSKIPLCANSQLLGLLDFHINCRLSHKLTKTYTHIQRSSFDNICPSSKTFILLSMLTFITSFPINPTAACKWYVISSLIISS